MRKLWNHYDPLDFDEVEKQEANPVQDSFTGPAELLESSAAVKHGGKRHKLSGREKQHRADVITALQQWRHASSYFDFVSDPQLVDYAILNMKVSQQRYIYLLQHNLDQQGNEVDMDMPS